MININSLIIRSKLVELYWVPLLFGLYNVFDILRKLNYYYKTSIILVNYFKDILKI